MKKIIAEILLRIVMLDELAFCFSTSLSLLTVKLDGKSASSDADLHWSIGNKKRRGWPVRHGQWVGVSSFPVYFQFRYAFVISTEIQTIANPHRQRLKIIVFTCSCSNDSFMCNRTWLGIQFDETFTN